MRPNRTNSFRLQRVSRASSMKKHSQTFYEPAELSKLPALNSVTRGVKKNDLSFVLGSDLNKLRKEPLDNNDGYYQSAHVNLAEIRKKYDDMKKQRTQKDQNIYRLKEQINKYQIFQNQYEGKIGTAKNQAEKKTQELKDKEMLVEETSMEKKVLQNMQQRLKWDKVVYDQRKFNLQKEEVFLKKQRNIFQKEGYQIGENTDRTNKVYNKLMKQLQAQRIERQQHINNLMNMIEKKQSLQMANQARQRQILQIAQRAMQDKDTNQKQWYKIFLTNQFVSKILRNKIDKQMEKFYIVQMAFKKIKTATGINDAQALIDKYLNKESAYGDLLGRITANQQKIAELKEETQRLLKQQKQLQIQKDTIQHIKLKDVDITGEMKELDIMEKKTKSVETNQSRTSQWLSKQFKKFQIIEKAQIQTNFSKGNQGLKEKFIAFLKLIIDSLQKCDKFQEEQTQAGDLTARDSTRVTRIIPKRSRKNSAGEQIFDVDQEEVPQNFDVEQNEILNHQRDQLLKTNEKFMKDARKRYEQQRKLMVQKQASKKQKKAPQVKKQQD